MFGEEGQLIEIKGRIIMNELSWKFTKPLVGKTSIIKLEKILGIILPDDFISCVMLNNAGYPSLQNFETSSGVDHLFSRLLSLDEQSAVNIFNTYDTMFSINGIENLLPFAGDPFGNYICYDFSEPILKIVFFDHETCEVDSICQTFSELIGKLSPSK